MVETMYLAALFPRTAITKDNYGPINTIITWILLVSMFLSVLAKVAVKLVYLHTFGTDDAALIAALVSSFLKTARMTTDSISLRFSVLGNQQQHLCRFFMESAAPSRR